MFKFKRFVNGDIEENAFIVYCPETKIGALVDPGFVEEDRIHKFLEKHEITLDKIINTHGHWDHINNNKLYMNKYDIPLYISKHDSDFLGDNSLNLSENYGFSLEPILDYESFVHGDKISIGNLSLEVVETPGHTKGSVVLLGENIVLTGDTLFNGSMGRCDFPTGSTEAMKETIDLLLSVVKDELIILPGHGIKELPFGNEKLKNAFLTGKMSPR